MEQVVAIKVNKDYGNLTIGGYEPTLLQGNDKTLNSSYSIRIKDQFKYMGNQYYSFKAEQFTLGNLSLTTSTHSSILHNTLEGVIIWTKDLNQKDNYDNELSKLLPTIICRETDNIVRCYL
jgi:hypothetical protein